MSVRKCRPWTFVHLFLKCAAFMHSVYSLLVLLMHPATEVHTPVQGSASRTFRQIAFYALG